MNVAFEDPATCALCDTPFVRDARAFRHHVTIGREHAAFESDFEIWRCLTCGVGITAPRPTLETTPLLYAEKTSADFDEVGHTPIDAIKDALALHQARATIGTRTVGSVLDFGAGNGRFAHAFKRALPQARVLAVDFTDTPPVADRSYFGRGIAYASYAEFAASTEHFDLIVCRHVLEHTHDPKAFLAALYERLTPCGSLEIEVPNLDSALARLAGALNPGYYVPRHLFHFTRRSMHHVAPFGALAAYGTRSMPLMGNLIADLVRKPRNTFAFQVLGVPLYALQWLADRLLGTSTCLTLKLTRPLCATPR